MNVLLTGLFMHPLTLIIILIIALLIFGKRLPEVARSLGKGITEFKKGVKGVEDEVERPLPPPSQSYPQGQYGEGQYSQPPLQQNPPYGQQPGSQGSPPQGQADTR